METTKDMLNNMLYDGVNTRHMEGHVARMGDACPAITRAYKRLEQAEEDLELIVKGELARREKL